MKKIPFTRLKIAQIEKDSLPVFILAWLTDNPAFIDTDSDVNNTICHADEFKKMQDYWFSNDYWVNTPNDLPIETFDILDDLHKQFISFDYLMIT